MINEAIPFKIPLEGLRAFSYFDGLDARNLLFQLMNRAESRAQMRNHGIALIICNSCLTVAIRDAIALFKSSGN